MSRSFFDKLRLSYAPTINYSLGTTVWLCCLYLLAGAGLLVWNFVTQAKQRVCVSTSASSFQTDSCSAATLRFFDTYYTKPLKFDGGPPIGTFPWQLQGFGNSNTNGPIDYSILAKNWTGDPLECALFEQVLVLRLESDSSTTSSCYYCGPDLRILCTSVDSERSSIPAPSVDSFSSLVQQYQSIISQLHAVATSAFEGATITSLRMIRHVHLPTLSEGVLPYTESSLTIQAGTTIGDSIETFTSRDLQPDVDSLTASKRTLLVNYLCTTCTKQYKPILEIIAIVISSTAALLGAFWTFLTFFSQLIVTWDAHNPFVDTPDARDELDSLVARSKSVPTLTRTQTPQGLVPVYSPISSGP
ncbi:hypothetical protein JCM8097_007440 [Rhodosporidiobolus ruineniae]